MTASRNSFFCRREFSILRVANTSWNSTIRRLNSTVWSCREKFPSHLIAGKIVSKLTHRTLVLVIFLSIYRMLKTISCTMVQRRIKKSRNNLFLFHRQHIIQKTVKFFNLIHVSRSVISSVGLTGNLKFLQN